MRLLSAPDGVVNRLDRAIFLTQPFDIAFAAPAVAPVGSIIVDRVDALSCITVDDFCIPQITFDDYDLSTSDIQIESVEVIP